MKRILLPLALSSLIFASAAQADGLRIGVVNIDTVAQKSAAALSFNSQISKEFQPRQLELNAAQKKLQDDMDKMNYSSYNMSTDDRNKLQATINTDKQNFDQLTVKLQNDLKAKQQQYTQSLMSQLSTVINKIAKDNHYDMIQTSANVLYISNTIDITDQVIQQMK